jgi:hypothetical protein
MAPARMRELDNDVKLNRRLFIREGCVPASHVDGAKHCTFLPALAFGTPRGRYL